MKKSRNRKPKTITLVLGAVALIVLACVVVFMLSVNIHFLGRSSANEGAHKYQTKTCLAFYPDGSENSLHYVEELCASAPKNSIFDYILIPYGECYRVEYGTGASIFLNSHGNDLKLESIGDEGIRMISDYLRYDMKRAEIDYAYTSSFMDESAAGSLDISDCTFGVKGEDLTVYFPRYDFTVCVPLKYIQKETGIDFGVDDEVYRKPHYISPNRKLICFTFDDGPNISVSNPTSDYIVERLDHYDSSATFFLIGTSIGNRQVEFIKSAIETGVEYGSHTLNHPYLTKLSGDEVRSQIMAPANILSSEIGYQMRLYRPPYGARNGNVDANAPLTAILWNVDSLDWQFRQGNDHDTAVSLIKEKVISQANDNDIVLFHDIYRTSVDAAAELIVYYLDQGYQVVNVSQLMQMLGVENVTYFSGR